VSCLEPLFLEKIPLDYCLLSEHLCSPAERARGIGGFKEWNEAMALGRADVATSWCHFVAGGCGWIAPLSLGLDVGFLKGSELCRFSGDWGFRLAFFGFCPPGQRDG
jgi:hypothetical protein